MTSMHIVRGTKPARYHLRPSLPQPGGIHKNLPSIKIWHERLSWLQAPLGPYLGHLPISLPSNQVPQILLILKWFSNILLIER